MSEPNAKELETIQEDVDVEDAIREQVAKLETLPDYELVRQWGSLADVIADIAQQQGLVEMVLTRKMIADEATVLAHATHDVELERPPIWDRTALKPLLEMDQITKEELDKAYAPAGEKTIPVEESWNLSYVKPLMKYGGEVKAIIEGAQSPGAPRLKIKKKKVRGIKT